MAHKRTVLVVLAGPPCAGKSAAARGLKARELGAELVVIEADTVYASLCEKEGLDVTVAADDTKASQTAAVWQASRAAVLSRVSDEVGISAVGTGNRIICVDDTSEHRSWRRKLASIARANCAAFLVVELRIPCDVSLSRNSHRPDATRVPEASVRRVCDMLETTASHTGGSSAWEAAFRTEIDGCLSQDRVVDRLETAISKAWSNTLPKPSQSAPATAPRISAVDIVDQQLRKAISVIIKQFQGVTDSSSTLSHAADAAEDLVLTASTLIRERLHGYDPTCAVREAAALLSGAKREALLAARSYST